MAFTSAKLCENIKLKALIRPVNFQLQIQYEGIDGIEGPFYVGTGCVHRRDALCGSERPQSSSKYHKAAYSIVCAEDESVAKDKTSPSKMLNHARDLANCTYEDNTLWGKEVGPTSLLNHIR